MNPFNNKIQSLLSNDRIANLIKYSNHCKDLGGYIFEAGVYAGGSLEILAMYNPGVNILAVDSFEGLPKVTDGKDFHREGDFNEVNFYSIAGYFKMIYPAVRIVKGWIPAVFDYFDENTFLSFCHIDLDIYKSVMDALEFCLPRLLTKGMILLDDYNCKSTPGCKSAIDDYFAANPDIVISHRGEVKYWDSENAPSSKQYLIVK